MILSTLKLSVASMIALKAFDSNKDIAISAGILVLICTLGLIFFALLKVNHSILSEPAIVTKMGSLYTGRNVASKRHKAHYFNLYFFLRRLIFATATVILFDYPQM